MTGRPLLLIAPVLLLTLLLSACLDEISAILEIAAYSESDDPEVKKTGEVLAKMKEEKDVQDALDSFASTGDPRFLEDARALRPDDTGLRAYDVVLAMRSGDPDAVEAAQEALALAEARRLEKLKSPDYQFETTAENLRRNVAGEILVAQINLLGGSLTTEWDPPGADADPETQQLYLDYCATRNQIMTEFNDDLSYIPNPPCPAA
jgi:hypothetical protein